MSRKAKKQKSRVVVDTNVLVAGISSFRKPYVRGKNPSADVLYKWAEKGNFVWLVTEDILDEYKEVLKMWLRMHGVPPISPPTKKQRNTFTDARTCVTPTLRLKAEMANPYEAQFKGTTIDFEVVSRILVCSCASAQHGVLAVSASASLPIRVACH